jgi:hypothetical protein
MPRQGNDDVMNENVEVRFPRLEHAPAFKAPRGYLSFGKQHAAAVERRASARERLRETWIFRYKERFHSAVIAKLR